MPTVLVADDDGAIRSSLSRALRVAGYEVILAGDGPQALRAAQEGAPDVAVLDIGMPGLSGLEVTRELRSKGSNTPILVLTAKVEVSDRVAGLDAGADDYLAKPFDLDELLARLRALLRRGATKIAQVSAHGITANSATRTAAIDGQDLLLTKIEFDLLFEFVSNPEIVLSQAYLYESVWGYDFGKRSKNLAVYVTYLRSKLETGGKGRLIHSVRGIGYVLKATQ